MRLSVIIPTLNEETTLAETLRSVRQEQPHEILVVDGGSTDATLAQAGLADRVLSGPRGRALQMNLGASHATGDTLLFLHADCRLHPGALKAVKSALRRRGVIAGCFRMEVEADGLFYRLIDACATARVRLTGIVYGDQGFFLRRETFNQAGGYPELRLMEDIFLSVRLRQWGRIVVVPHGLGVSARRWERRGLIRQTLRNWTLTALAAAGVSPNQLARFYPVVR